MHIAPPRTHALNVVGAWGLAVADAIQQSSAATTGLAGAGPAALVVIEADPDLSIDELRKALGLTHPGAVRLVDRLVERGWVRRHPGRGRTVRLRLTRRGQDTHHRLLAARLAAIATVTEALAHDTLERVAELVAPSLAAASTDTDQLRRLCRLCQRADCEPCPVARALGCGVDAPG